MNEGVNIHLARKRTPEYLYLRMQGWRQHQLEMHSPETMSALASLTIRQLRFVILKRKNSSNKLPKKTTAAEGLDLDRLLREPGSRRMTNRESNCAEAQQQSVFVDTCGVILPVNDA